MKPILCLLALASVAACTSAQKADARTALTVSQCINGVVLRHVNEDIKDPAVIATVAAEIATECNPTFGIE